MFPQHSLPVAGTGNANVLKCQKEEKIMAKINVVGAAVTITSSAKLEDLRKVKQFRPEVLTLKDEDGEPVFVVGIGKKADECGDFGKFGIEFAAHPDINGHAFVTAMFSPEYYSEDGDLKEKIAKAYGDVIVNLENVEAVLPTTIAEIDAKIASVMEHITIG